MNNYGLHDTVVTKAITAAQKGAKLLDENKHLLPQGRQAWWHHINTIHLDLSHADRCILGQLFTTDDDYHGYATGKELLGMRHSSDVYEYGYCPNTPAGVSNGDLVRAWKSEIEARRSGTFPIPAEAPAQPAGLILTDAQKAILQRLVGTYASEIEQLAGHAGPNTVNLLVGEQRTVSELRDLLRG